MNKLIIVGFVWCAGVATCGWSQEIKVTTTGVEVGAAGSSASGSLMQQSGQTTSFVTKDGVNPPEVRMVIKPDGKVGVGTSAPTEKLEVAGNIKVIDAVLSPLGTAPLYACRAWVSFDGKRNAAGTADTANTARFIKAAGNVESVIRNGVGDYTVNFSVAMPDANYCPQLTTRSSNDGTYAVCAYLSSLSTPVAGSFRMRTNASGAGYLDLDTVNVVVFR